MPLFDFVCRKCGNKEEVLLTCHNITILDCQKCDGVADRQFPTGTKPIFLGGNWSDNNYGK